MNASMKRMIILLCCLLSSIIAFGQDPKPPTQEWCKWAFAQIPDQKSLSEVDSTAFSDEFYCLLKELDRLCTWEEETYQCKPDGADCLHYWYSDMESTRLEGDRAKVYFDFTPNPPLEGEVLVTIDHPDYMNYDGTRVSKYRMSVKYENGAWRIDDWPDLNLSDSRAGNSPGFSEAIRFPRTGRSVQGGPAGGGARPARWR